MTEKKNYAKNLRNRNKMKNTKESIEGKKSKKGQNNLSKKEKPKDNNLWRQKGQLKELVHLSTQKYKRDMKRSAYFLYQKKKRGNQQK